jgi:NADH dehydrogenase [ubiquinone] 1 alpha subcomplex assembly factor 5
LTAAPSGGAIASIRNLVASSRSSHKRPVSAPLFDHDLRAARRDRAVRMGTETFLYDRAFDDCLERLADIHAAFRNVLLVGCPNPAWPDRLSPEEVHVVEAGRMMAARAGATRARLESLPFGADTFDLCICIGELEAANNLPLAAAALHLVLKPGGLLLGAAAGGQSLPRLRKAMVAADTVSGQASPHVHPRIDAPGLAQLLSTVGFASPVIDVDRVELSYGSLDGLVRDLRAMGATNVLTSRSRQPLTHAALNAARNAFMEGDKRASESLEILHFAAWKA